VAENSTLKDLLAKYSEIIEFKAEEELFNYGQKADNIYFVLSGLIRVFIRDNNQEVEIKRNKNGDFVGETAFTVEKYSSRAEVYLDSKLLKFNVSDLRKIMKKNNEFANKMIDNLATYIDKLQNKEKLNLTSISELDKKIEAENEIKETLAAKTKKKKYLNQAADKIKSRGNFYLKEHSSYNKKAEKDDQYYLYDKETKCPVCSNKLQIKKIRNSRLRIEEIREDLRPLYKNFNLYFYSVLSCPDCLFTARRKDFYDFSKNRKKKIKNNFKSIITDQLGDNFKIEYSDPRTINEVLDAHYLSLKLYDYINMNADKKAFLWREISWIYEDLKEEKLSKKASLKALENLEEFYFKDDSSSSKKETDNISLLLSVLYYKHGQKQKALPLLDDLIRDARVNLRQKNKARDLFVKIRKENKKEKK